MNDETIIVTGFGRCGTTLVMRMLDAGGVPIACNSRASYELDLLSQPHAAAPWTDFAGQAVKVLDPHRWKFAAEDRLRFLFISRDAREQAKSQAKFFGEIQGLKIDRAHRRRIEVSLRRDYFKAPKSLQPHPALFLKFEEILAEPYEAARQIQRFVNFDLDTLLMGSVVLRRPPACMPDLRIEYSAIQAEMAGAA